MNERIKEFFIGKECYECKALGVFCVQPGILPVYPAEVCTVEKEPIAPTGGSAIYIDGTQKLQVKESIDKCPAVTGQNSKEEVVAKLRGNAEKAWGRIVIDQVGNY